ncbi:hypothetical protein FB550_113103 [Neobacillus bataviensis]|uniref:Uncharacterized protein n=1 Tax=Neobacillus bataviensis TaxID=220685 RepID=A0A561CU37_9BACI|nr:hypothetical protein FB550_113103 [Neobacillus bataviensis]
MKRILFEKKEIDKKKKIDINLCLTENKKEVTKFQFQKVKFFDIMIY